MSHAAFTLRVFGYYLLVLGVVLILVPNALLSLFAMPTTTEVWIRVVGVLVVNIGVYYLGAAQSGARAVLVASIYARAFVFVAFSAFWFLGLAAPMLVFFGAVDLAGGVWTWKALATDASRAV